MTTITLEIPDELTTQFRIDPTALSALIREAVAAKSAKLVPPANGEHAAPPLYQEMIDFLASSPTTEQLVAFKISASAQERLEELLDKNREEGLRPEERAELDTYLHLSDLMTRLKARARSGQPLFN